MENKSHRIYTETYWTLAWGNINYFYLIGFALVFCGHLKCMSTMLQRISIISGKIRRYILTS